MMQSFDKQISEVAKLITDYIDCGDCKNCLFHGICYEEEAAKRIVLAGYHKVDEEGKN